MQDQARRPQSTDPVKFQHLPEVEVYRRLAKFYDDFYEDSEYEAGAATILSEVKRGIGTRGTTLLDVGAGTGRFARYFSGWSRVYALEPEPAMLRFLRRWAPAAVPLKCQVEALDPHLRFDVVTALGGVAAYIGNLKRVHDWLLTLRDHLKDGGILLVDPWHTPLTASRISSTALVKSGSGPRWGNRTTRVGCRFNVLRFDGGKTHTRYYYVIQSLRTNRVQAFSVDSTLRVFATHTFLATMRSAGFRRVRALHNPRGFRALYCGVK